MSDLVPAVAGGSTPSVLTPLTDPALGGASARLRAFMGQTLVRRALPWFAGMSAAGLAGVLWMTMAPAPQRMLYSQLSDNERAQVVAALDKASIPYTIDNSTGAITVPESDLYKARMVAASDGAIAAPETGQQMIDKLPMGASRTLEGQRLQAARERELELTMMEIDGVEAVRVHLAEPEKLVFVRDNVAPSASVMVKLARGRQLSDSQVSAIVNLMAVLVPGLFVDSVKVIDQHGRLLSAAKAGDSDRIEIQGRMEDKLRQQVSQLLTPMLGDGNFSSEIQVDLDMDQVTSARESYDKQGAVRTELQSASQSAGAAGAIGVPGVLSNTPPPATTAQPGAPQGTPAQGAQAANGQAPGTPGTPGTPATPPSNGESSSTRTYELGREVAVSNVAPGKIKRLLVAVAVSQEAMAKAKPADIEQIKQLVSAAVGADPTRGDQVAVAIRSFKPAVVEAPKFYETPWFATILRNAVALLAVLLVLLLGVRPLIKALKRDPAASKRSKAENDDEEAPEDGEGAVSAPKPLVAKADLRPAQDASTGVVDTELLSRQVGIAQRLVKEKPDSAVAALRQMLKENTEEAV